MKHLISWFEIPANDFGRAVRFYKTVLDLEVQETEMYGTRMGLFPGDGNNISGAIVKGEDYRPSKEGTIVYLNGGKDLSVPLSRVEKAGGQILVPKTQINEEMGYFALFIDTEGNKLAFHSVN